MQVQDIQVGWKWLEGVLNRIIGAINGNEPLEGSGIRIVDTSNGKLISVAAETTGQGSGGGGAQTTTAVQPHELIDTLYWHNVKWQQVIVVDPSTCAQSTLTVLVQTGNYNDIITLDLDVSVWVTRKPPSP